MSSVKIYAAPLIYQNVTILPTSWTASTTFDGYPYEATISLDEVTEEHIPEVSFDPSYALYYMFAPNAITNNGSVTIYAANQPDHLIVIPSIICVNGSIRTGGDVDSVLDNNSWDVINQVASSGQASAIWNIGDTKKIILNGTVGSLSLSNYETYVYIIGFDHNGTTNTIDFGTFKNAQTNGVNVALVDAAFSGNATTDGTLNFNIQHWGSYTYGGWAGCDMRYDILGSTDTPPSGYGANATSGRTGYDASSTCATNPVANTLMSTLPLELRTAMKPMAIYTDNVAGGTGDVESNVTVSVDYLPLLAEFEIFGSRFCANSYEKNNQAQYAYYANGNSKIKYRYDSTSTVVQWWQRSPLSYKNYSQDFCNVYTNGDEWYLTTYFSLGLAPIFRVGGNGSPHIITIDGDPYLVHVGMTWADWVNSDYNTIGATVSESNQMIKVGVDYVHDGNRFVSPTDGIMFGDFTLMSNK